MTNKEPAAAADDGFVLTPKLIVGAFIALAGVLLTLDNLALLEARYFLRLWPLALVAVGAVMFARAGDRGGRVSGVIAMAVGSWLLLNTLGLVRVRIWEFFWPIVLITLGTNLILQTLRRGREAMPSDPSSTVHLFAMMSGSKQTSNTSNFRGGDMTAFMGGCELDLRQASIGEGGTAILDVVAIMGGHEIRVPLGWRIVSRAVPIMGGVVDNTVPVKDMTGPSLVLRGLVMMGGVEIKN